MDGAPDRLWRIEGNKAKAAIFPPDLLWRRGDTNAKGNGEMRIADGAVDRALVNSQAGANLD
jgi:hypothetical protein